MATVWQSLRAHATAAGVGLSALGIAGAYIWNGTETRRMARNIQKGLHRPDASREFIKEYCVFSSDGIHTGLNSNGMVALIGLKATGKTTTLKHLLSNAENPLFVNIHNDDVHGAIYRELRKKVWSLPWLADGLRADAGTCHTDRVAEVLLMVKEQSDKPVLLGFDVNARSMQYPLNDRPQMDKVWEAISSTPVQVPIRFDPVNFVKDVKYLVEDCNVAKAIITSSEGLEFMAVNEGRLRKILGREMPLAAAAAYVQEHVKAGGYHEEMYQFPRTFDNLKAFAEASDKEVFCHTKMMEEINKIKESREFCKNAEALYRTAVQQGRVDIDIIKEQCTTKMSFVNHFVKTNIFVPCPGAGYELQFDCTKQAAKAVFGF